MKQTEKLIAALREIRELFAGDWTSRGEWVRFVCNEALEFEDGSDNA